MTMDDVNNPVLHYGNTTSHNDVIERHIQEEIPNSSRPTNFGFNYSTHAQMMTSFQDEEEDEVKRPMNSFLLWAKIMRKKYASKNPNMHNAEISKLLGKIWNSMTTKDKRPYVEQAEKLRVLHMRTYPNYRYAPKKRKERRNHRMISPEVAAALHNTLFDVNNIISEQISQNQMLADNLKSYGYLRNALKHKQTRNPDPIPDSRSSSPKPDPINLPQTMTSPTVTNEPSPRVKEQIRKMTITESMTLHYRPTSSQDNQTPLDSHQGICYTSPSSSETSESELEEMSIPSSIGDEFSHYLRQTIKSTRTNDEKRTIEVGEDDFWNDITDIITSGSL